MPRKSSNGRTRANCAPDVFVKAWVKATHTNGTVMDVSEGTGLTLGGVHAKARRLRDEGVKLPKLARRIKNPIDVAALNALLK